MNRLIFLTWILLYISCTQSREQVHILRIYDPSNEHQEWTKVCEDNNFLLDQRTDFSFLDEDSLNHFSAIILDQVDLNPLDHFQANALKRYLLAGGGLLHIQSKASESAQYKWPWLYHLIQKSSTSLRINHSESYRLSPIQKGRMVQPYSLPSSSEEMLSALKAAIGPNSFLNYDKVMEEVSPPEHWFEIQSLASNFNEPQEMEVLPNGDVLFIERGGGIQLYQAEEKQVQLLANIPVWNSQSNGLTGMALAPDFEETGWVYFLFAGKEDSTHLQVARFHLAQEQLDLKSKQIIFKIPIQLRLGWHGENSLAFDSKGNLYISLGDFTLQSRDIAGYAQIDERPGKAVHDAQRTSANSNSLLGK
ncbi:MAG: PQQ-dependent sugar dehydrogenase, partial [Bacteroidota bacterium]